MKTTNERFRPLGIVALVLLGALLIYNAGFTFSFSIGPNYRNVSVDTRANITNAPPQIVLVTVTDPVTLNAGSTVNVTCNATILDYNGGSTITNVSAVFYDNNSVSFNDTDDNNTLYTDAECARIDQNGFYANFTCGFDVQYYANNGTNWICNVTANDNFTFTGNVTGTTSAYNTTTINTLLALNVTTLIDYGDLSVGDTSGSQEANVTNFGNVDINVSVRGYGVSKNDGLALNCSQGTISIENEKFSLNETGDFILDYIALNISYQAVPGLTLAQQTNDSLQVRNSTFWRLYVPPNPFGECNGTVVFQAETAST